MSYRKGHRARLSRQPGRRAAGAGLTLAGLLLAVAGCGHVLPLGLAAVPVPGRLATAIVLQPGDPAPATQSVAGQGPPSAPSCPAGYALLPSAGRFPGGGGCFRKLGRPATFTSAAVTVGHQPAGPHGQPSQYVLRVTLTAAGAAALTAVTTEVAGTRTGLAFIIDGQAWAVVITLRPLTQGEFEIPVQSLSQALQLQRVLLPHG